VQHQSAAVTPNDIDLRRLAPATDLRQRPVLGCGLARLRARFPPTLEAGRTALAERRWCVRLAEDGPDITDLPSARQDLRHIRAINSQPVRKLRMRSGPSAP
jgi:hypothetical protein